MPKNKIDREALDLGARLVQLLADNGIHRHGAGAYLQRRYKVANVTANDWLNGKFKPTPETARRIAEDHGATFDFLYSGKAHASDLDPDQRRQSIKIAHLENDIHALNIALGALVATMVVHRPAEAAEAAAAFRKAVPREFADKGLIPELIAVLESGKAARK